MATVLPDWWMILRMTPEPGEGTSTVALSLSTSTSGSSALTASPTPRFHLPIIASVMDSPSAGIFR